MTAIDSAGDGDGQAHEYAPGREWMETFSGRRCNPLDEAPDCALDDLIWGTARACRYAGQLREGVEIYSVAEHQVLLTRWAAAALPLDARALRTLALHDATEGIMGDMIRPLKRLFPAFGAAEARFYSRLARRFDLIDPLPEWLHRLDSRVIRDERAQALNPSGNRWTTDALEPLGVTLQFWLPSRAAAEYRRLLAELDVTG